MFQFSVSLGKNRRVDGLEGKVELAAVGDGAREDFGGDGEVVAAVELVERPADGPEEAGGGGGGGRLRAWPPRRGAPSSC